LNHDGGMSSTECPCSSSVKAKPQYKTL